MTNLVTKLLLALAMLLPFGAPAHARAMEGRGPAVLAASSLQEAINAAADGWAAEGHARPVISLASSAALARQIEAGAPADIFISADAQWMDEISAKGLTFPASRRDLVGNRLVLIAPAASRVRLSITRGFPLAAALGEGRLASGATTSVPAGIYAKQALTALGVWDAVAGRLAETENVRAALALVKHGEVPLGIVYATDARAEPGVRIVGVFPESSHKPIRYPLAVLTASRHPDAAAFERFLLSAKGRAILLRFGFVGV